MSFDFNRGFRSKLKVPVKSFDSVEAVRKTKKFTGTNSSMKRILVINSKGGCGKSTVSINLAALLQENKKNNVALIDYDPQGSSKKWLSSRSKRLRSLTGLFPGSDNVVHFRRTWYLLLDQGTSHAVIDTPAGTSGIELSERISQCDLMIIPVMPSAIDMRASADFIGKVITNPKFRGSNKRLAVVANRVTHGSDSFEKLERFLFSLNIPFVATFNEHSHYLVAAEHGCGVNELPPSNNFFDIEEWQKLMSWIDGG